MAICAGIKRDGGRCTASVEPPQTYCWWHDPANAEKRRKAAARGGRGKSSRELHTIKQRLSVLAENVLEGAVDKGRAAVASQVLNTYIRAVSVELKAREQLELIERLEALEAALESKDGGRRWGA